MDAATRRYLTALGIPRRDHCYYDPDMSSDVSRAMMLADKKRSKRADDDADELDDEDTDEGLDDEGDESMDDGDDSTDLDDDELDDDAELDDEEDFHSPQMQRNGRGGVSPDGMIDGTDFEDESARENAGGQRRAARYSKWRSSSSKGQPAPMASQSKLQEHIETLALAEYRKPASRLTHAELTAVQLRAADEIGYRGDDGAAYTLDDEDQEDREADLQRQVEAIARHVYGKPVSRLTHQQLAEAQRDAAKMTGY